MKFNLVSLNTEIENYQLAEEYLASIDSIFPEIEEKLLGTEKEAWKQRKILFQISIGLLYLKIGQLETAVKYLSELIIELKNNEQDYEEQSLVVLMGLGKAFLGMGRYLEALDAARSLQRIQNLGSNTGGLG